MAGTSRHLRKRGDNYSVRVAVPAELRHIIGKSELTQKVGTERRTAERQAFQVVAEFQAQIDQARARLGAKTPLSTREAARAFYNRELGRDADERTVSGDVRRWMADTERFLATKLDQVQRGAVDDEEAEALVGWAADEMITRGEVTDAPRGSAVRRQLLQELAGVKIETLQRAADRDAGAIILPEPKNPLLADKAEPAAPIVISEANRSRVLCDGSLKPLSEILPTFHAERRIADKTGDEHRVAIRMLEEFLGEPKPVAEIVRRDMLAFKTALTRTPNRYTLRFPGLTLPEAIEANAKRKEPFDALSATTINKKWLAHLKAIFAWCADNSLIPDNPAAGVGIKEGKGMKERTRVEFSPDDLNRIFGEHFAPDGRFGTNQWALLVALFTGARSQSEIRRIKLSDVRQEQGVLVFNLEEASKNLNSKRLVPVHQRLIELGLMEHVDALRRAGETRLFPDWEPDDKVNRWFLRTYKPRVGIHDDRKVFHCFRNTMLKALASVGIAREVRELIAGHADQSMSNVYITERHTTMAGLMAEALNRVEFSGVDWRAMRPNLRASACS